MKQRVLMVALFAMASLLGCVAGAPRTASEVSLSTPDAPRAATPLFDGMGEHTRPVASASPLAQRYFDQGLIWAFAFNHDEAIRSFQQAAQIDDRCAMAWWGVALCHGPHINNPVVTEERARAAWDALQAAQARRATAAPVEQALIDALAARYAWPAPADRRPLDEAYARAMERVHRQFPDDLDVTTLYAEALMDLQPWNLWTQAGAPIGQTPQILAALEQVLARNPRHPGAAHLYIHACEASPFPERADAAAAVLRSAVPASGHLVHMPAHIDVQLGRWSLAADQNVRAAEADRRYREISPRQGFYRVYMAHNHHFLAFACMMEGRREAAMTAARDMLAGVPPEFARDNAAMIDCFMPIALEVMMRFGRWDELLAEPPPSERFPIATALWRFMRGVAFAAKGQVTEARAEQAAFELAAAIVPPEALMMINPAVKVLAIARRMLEGEIAYREKRFDDAIAELRAAVALEDELLYMEPPDWIQPVRHTLGAVLLDAGRHLEAEQVYRADLKIWPENGWSLHGLANALRGRDATEEARDVEARFDKAWARSDTRIAASCLCVRR